MSLQLLEYGPWMTLSYYYSNFDLSMCKIHWITICVLALKEQIKFVSSVVEVI